MSPSRFLATLAVAAATLALVAANTQVTLTPAQRAQAMLAKMNQTEKFNMIRGSVGPYVGNVAAVERLGIPALNLNDGPQGFRGDAGTSTCWPSGLTIAATWNVASMGKWGDAMGKEFVAKGANIQLGPAVCLARVPVNGRNFEYLSGEDPFLGYTLVQPAIRGIQQNGVIANVKHFINNNQETNRWFVSANIDERTQWELYMPPFIGAVEAGVMSAMCSYNRINNVYSCEDPVTLNNSLKGIVGFQGFVMSDWTATHSTVASANAGLDQEMPLGLFYSDLALQLALDGGDIQQSTIDDKVLRILTAMYTVGIFDTPNHGNISANVTSPEHNALARTLASEAMVLLKNSNGVLPLNAQSLTRVAVLGDACDTAPIVAGGGSGAVAPPYIITVLTGVTNALGVNGQAMYVGTSDVTQAVEVARQADVAIVCTATTSSEGIDRWDLSLPSAENTLIAAVAAAQPKTIVVVTSPGAVVLPWIDNVAAAVATFLPGQEAGNAVADVLFGVVNPSGKLPLTFPHDENPTNFTQAQYPGEPAYFPLEANYSEQLLVGYRYYDAHGITPLFPFGHGLSYTTFKYTNLNITQYTVQFQVTNAGVLKGAEVAQLYIAFPPAAHEPPMQLKGFEKVMLASGQTVTVSITLTQRDLSIWDVSQHAWVQQHGVFGVYVGSSSRDIRLKGTISH